MNFTLPLPPIQTARFVARPNRFLVRCRLDSGSTVTAFLPNPGRLWELFFPDVALYVTHQAGAERKTDYTVVAVLRDGVPVFLHTHLSNQVARKLLDHGAIPGLADAHVVRAEYPVGSSRFDFLLQQGRRQIYLEVKSCTLFGNRVAMFPDAVTSRGRRHLLELAELRSRNVRTCVLFLVQTPHVDWFMPDYHTDLDFSRALLEVRHRVDLIPVSTTWHEDLSFSSEVRPLPIPWSHLRREIVDRGSYLLILHLDRDQPIAVGRLGGMTFRSGYHVYVGSALNGLTPRIARHQRRRKRFHWHIDYLRDVASHVTALPIRSSRRQECQIAAALGKVLRPGPERFGSSDCPCDTHLYWHPSDPLDLPAFHRVLQQFRMQPPSPP